MHQAVGELQVSTPGKGLVDISEQIRRWVAEQSIRKGLLTVWCRHTSASLTVQENADPRVRDDIARFFDGLAPEDPARYAHSDEGDDDMPAHLRAMLTQTQLSIPVVNACPVLGTWQGVFVFEHRRQPHRRNIVLHLLGE